jgi:hypothetical protein
VIKKLFKIAITFGVLLTAYAGYVRLFAIVAERAALSWPRAVQLLPTASKTMKEAIALAARANGADDWSAKRDLQVRYYNRERGYWMYAREYERLNDGKQLRFRPFCLITESRGKPDLKIVTSDEAIIDLDQPMGLAVNKPGSKPLRVIHAQLTGNVRIRDDKGTADKADDLHIGPMPYVMYDEPTLQIKSDSAEAVVIEDQEMRVTGYDLLIQLRPKEESDPTSTSTAASTSSAGFDGAKTAYLKRDVHILLYDVGRSGILPGTAQVEQTAQGRTPLDLRCAGEMQSDLP